MAMTQEAFTEPQWSLGDRLRKSREHAGLSRDELAERLGVKKNSLWNWETDASRPRDLLTLIRKWSAETKAPVQWILGLSSDSMYELTNTLRVIAGGSGAEGCLSTFAE